MDERTKQVLVGIIVAVIFYRVCSPYHYRSEKYRTAGASDNACRTCGSDRTSCFL